jgi:hypothetical protein
VRNHVTRKSPQLQQPSHSPSVITLQFCFWIMHAAPKRLLRRMQVDKAVHRVRTLPLNRGNYITAEQKL